MKKVRLFLLLFIVLFLSGCSGVYELTINEDLSVLESATITLDSNSDSFDKVNNLIKLYDIPEEDYTIKESENSLRVSFSKKFSSFDEYVLNSKLYPNLVSNIYYTLVDKKLTIDAPAIFSTGIKNNDNIVNNYDIGLLKIYLTFSFVHQLYFTIFFCLCKTKYYYNLLIIFFLLDIFLYKHLMLLL